MTINLTGFNVLVAVDKALTNFIITEEGIKKGHAIAKIETKGPDCFDDSYFKVGDYCAFNTSINPALKENLYVISDLACRNSIITKDEINKWMEMEKQCKL